jgi:hypothetical protein
MVQHHGHVFWKTFNDISKEFSASFFRVGEYEIKGVWHILMAECGMVTLWFAKE